MAVNEKFRQAVLSLVRTLASRRYLNMGFYRSVTLDDLADGASATFSVTATEPIAIQKIELFAAGGGAAVLNGVNLKVVVGDTTVIPSGIDLTGDGVQADRDSIPLNVFNLADTTGEMLLLLTPGQGNQSTEGVITVTNNSGGALNDLVCVVSGSRLYPQRY